MANERPAPQVTTLEVVRTESVTRNLVRVVLGGPGIATYAHNDFTDRYVKLAFPPPGVTYPEPIDMAALRRDLPIEQRPTMRTYTVRGYDADAGQLWIDFVVHGDEGIAAPWARAAQAGDRLHLLGPGGAYAPDPDVAWHLFVADTSALPATASAIEAIEASGSGAGIVAVLDVADEAEGAYLDLPARAEVHWLFHGHGAHQAGGDLDAAGQVLLDAVRALTFPEGDVQAFVHAELGTIRALRRHLLDDRGVDPARLSLSGYWRRGKDEDGFQAEKADEARVAREAAATS